jgi:hypothetical protein
VIPLPDLDADSPGTKRRNCPSHARDGTHGGFDGTGQRAEGAAGDRAGRAGARVSSRRCRGAGGGMKLGRSRPCWSHSALPAASWTEVLRPGTALRGRIDDQALKRAFQHRIDRFQEYQVPRNAGSMARRLRKPMLQASPRRGYKSRLTPEPHGCSALPITCRTVPLDRAAWPRTGGAAVAGHRPPPEEGGQQRLSSCERRAWHSANRAVLVASPSAATDVDTQRTNGAACLAWLPATEGGADRCHRFD